MQGKPINHADELDHPTEEDPLEAEIRRLSRHVEALEQAVKHQHPETELPEAPACRDSVSIPWKKSAASA